jgi:hypothetical protein
MKGVDYQSPQCTAVEAQPGHQRTCALVGDLVEPPRKFIQSNALSGANLDV